MLTRTAHAPASPELSVVIATFERADLLRRCLESFCEQTVEPGRKEFESRCARCHGGDGNGGEMGPSIAMRLPTFDDKQLAHLILGGIPAKGMPPNVVADAEMATLLKFLRRIERRANDVPAVRMSLRLLNLPLAEYGKAQLPGILIALMAGLVATPVRFLFHTYGSPDWLTLIVTTLVSCLSVAGLFFWRPQTLGVYGTDALIMVFESVPTRFFPKVILQWFNTRIIGRPA